MIKYCKFVFAAFSLITITAQATNYYVSAYGSDAWAGTNWATAKQTIQAAVNIAVPNTNSIVWVTNGTYTVNSYVGVNAGITVRSVNGPLVTAVEVGSSYTDMVFYITGGAIIDGFKIANGRRPSSYGGGVMFADVSVNCTVRNCIIVSNSASSGGGIYCVRMGIVQNCLIYGNTAGSGGGIYLQGDEAAKAPLIQNCTIVSNLATGVLWFQGGGGIKIESRGIIENCILYSNQATTGVAADDNYFNFTPAEITWSNSCTVPAITVVAGITTQNMVYANPLFINPVSDFRLDRTSPGIDAGMYQDWMTGAVDLDGRRRINQVNGRVDMGAYEYIPSITIISIH